MASLNRIVILGNILSDPDTRFTVEGKPVAKFNLPVGNGFNQAPGKIEIVCFGKLAEICGQSVKNGSNVLVEGRLQIRSFDDASGTRKWATEVIATDIQFVDSAKSISEAQSPAAVSAASKDEEEVEELPEDDLPF